MRYLILMLILTSCETPQIPKPVSVEKITKSYGLNPHPTGSSFYPIYLPNLKSNGK
jgi:hypothetical protein